MSFLNRVCHKLTNAKVDYAVVGGYAVALHGAVRGTVDIDLVVRWTLLNLEKTENALSEIGLQSSLPLNAKDVFKYREEYIRNRNLVAWNFHNPEDISEQVDLIIAYDLKGKKTKRLDTRDGIVRVLSRKDLIEMKRRSGRPQDLEDVAALKKLK